MTTVKEYADEHKTSPSNIMQVLFKGRTPVTLNQELTDEQIAFLNTQQPWPARTPVKKAPAVYSSRTADKFVVRLPDGVRDRVGAIAEGKHLSMNAQLIFWIEKCLEIEEENPNGFSKEALIEAFQEIDPGSCVIVPMQHQNYTPAPGCPVRVKCDGGVWVVKRYVAREGEVKVILECFMDDSNHTALLDVDLDQLEPV